MKKKREGKNRRIGRKKKNRGRERERKQKTEKKTTKEKEGRRRARELHKRKKRSREGKERNEEVGRRENRGEAATITATIPAAADDNNHPPRQVLFSPSLPRFLLFFLLSFCMQNVSNSRFAA
jgi:hypothetical protein